MTTGLPVSLREADHRTTPGEQASAASSSRVGGASVQAASSFLFVLCMVGAVPAGAVSALPDSGTRIRLTARMPEREQAVGRTSVFGSAPLVHAQFTGPFVSVAHDTVTMHDREMTGALVTIPTPRVLRFEISRGEHPRGLRGAGVGFVLGALVGAGVAYFGTNSENSEFGVGFNMVAGAAVLGAIGGAIGGVLGAVSPSERWRDLPLENLRGTSRP